MSDAPLNFGGTDALSAASFVAITDRTGFQAFFSSLVQSVNQKLNAGLNFEQVLDFVFEFLGLTIPYDRMGIALLENGGDQIRSRWVRSKVPISHLNKGYAAPLAGSSLQAILETGEPRIIDDLRKYSLEHPESHSTKLILKDGMRSSLTCPLLAHGKPIGIVFFSSCKPRSYLREHIAAFRSVADELSIIVEQGRLSAFYEAGHAKSKSFAMVLHDLRSPLCVIDGFLGLATDSSWYSALDTSDKEIFSVMKRNIGYMHTLVKDLAELEQTAQGEGSLDLQIVPLAKFCADVARDGRVQASAKGMQLTVDLAIDLPYAAKFDPHDIRRVLDNLLTNAVKFSHRKTEIVLRVWHDDGLLYFSVTDQGPGIPQSERQKLFREFSKTTVRPTEGEQSTGLGLAIAKKIVDKHGGEIFIESIVGQGSTLSFYLPLTT